MFDLRPSFVYAKHVRAAQEVEPTVLLALFNSTAGDTWVNRKGWTAASMGPLNEHLNEPARPSKSKIPPPPLFVPKTVTLPGLPHNIHGVGMVARGSSPSMSITDLNLSKNNLSGGLPASICNLKQLRTLQLQVH